MLCTKYHEQSPTGHCDQESFFKKIVDLLNPDGIFCKDCKKVTTHKRVRNRRAYACNLCFRQTYPLAGTIFNRSRTCLADWFSAFHLFITTRAGLSAKHLERYIKVTYKTAWRILMRIRKLMHEELGKLKGAVEVDETWMNGGTYFKFRPFWLSHEEKPTQIVMGFVERKGRLKTILIDDTSRYTLTNSIEAHIDASAWVITDSHQGYAHLDKHGYKHDSVNHTETYVRKDNPLIHTQTIEGAWSQIKRGIYGTYRRVRNDYLPLYLDEYCFRYNHRKESPSKILELLFSRILKFDEFVNQ